MKSSKTITFLFSFALLLPACETPPTADSKVLYPGDRFMVAGVEVSCAPEPIPPPDIVPEELEPEPPVAKAPDLILLKGETSEIRLPAGPCPSITPPSGIFTEVLELRPYTATHESYRGLPAGEYLDAVAPCTTGERGLWLDVTAARDAKPGLYEVAGKDVLVLDAELPEKPTMPFYAAVNWDDVKRLWGRDPHASVFNRQMLDWIRFARAHRIEPFVQFPTLHAPEDLRIYNEFGIDYREMVINGAIAPPILVRPNVPVTDSTLQAIERRIKDGTFPKGSLGYLWDEGQPGSLAQVRARAEAARIHAPSLRRFVTWEPLPEIRSLYDVFVPVLDWRGAHVPVSDYAGVSYGHYSSCMAQGRCHDSGSPANPSGTPLMVVGSPEIHQRMFPIVVHALGGEFALYYTLTKHVDTAWNPGGQWNEGGEGDGTALYAIDRKPVASVRVKGIRKGMNDIEYARLLGFDLKQLVTSHRVWNKEHAPLDDLRVQLAKKLGALK